MRAHYARAPRSDARIRPRARECTPAAWVWCQGMVLGGLWGVFPLWYSGGIGEGACTPTPGTRGGVHTLQQGWCAHPRAQCTVVSSIDLCYRPHPVLCTTAGAVSTTARSNTKVLCEHRSSYHAVRRVLLCSMPYELPRDSRIG